MITFTFLIFLNLQNNFIIKTERQSNRQIREIDENKDILVLTWVVLEYSKTMWLNNIFKYKSRK